MAKKRASKRGGQRAVISAWPLLDSNEFARAQKDASRKGAEEKRAASAVAMARAAVLVSGDLGYEQMTVERLLERSESNRDRFYGAYANKGDCYAAGYTAAIDQLTERVLAAGRSAPHWPAGMRSALEELATFIDSERYLARGLTTEVYVADGAALAKRKEVFERLSRAIDRARRETDEPRHSPPPITSAFILGGIEASIRKTFQEGPSNFANDLPGLTYMSVVFYFGDDAARAEADRLT